VVAGGFCQCDQPHATSRMCNKVHKTLLSTCTRLAGVSCGVLREWSMATQ
jgi:hypothetical protein